MSKNITGTGKRIETSTMGICFLATNIDASTGGVQRISLNLLQEFNKRGHKTFVCSRNYFKRQRDESVNQTLIHRSPTFKHFSAILNSVFYLLDGLYWLIRHRKQYDVIHCQQIFAPAMLGLLARTILRKPVLVGVHSAGSWGEINELKNSPLRAIRLWQLGSADCWVVLNHEMREELKGLGIAEEKIKLIPNATTIPNEAAYLPGVKQTYRAKLNLPYQHLAIFTGRLSAEKGLDILINAWSKISEQHPQAHLLILGQGGGFPDVESEIKALCHQLNLNETVHFLGFKSNPIDYLLASDIFVLPTRTEGMSVSIIEAMASGIAIVTTNIPPNLYLCHNNVNSLLVNPDDAESLAESVNRIFRNTMLQEQFGRAAREKACRDFSVEVVADRYLTLYAELVEATEVGAGQ